MNKSYIDLFVDGSIFVPYKYEILSIKEFKNLINNTKISESDFNESFTDQETFEVTKKLNLNQLFCFLLAFELFEIDSSNKNVILTKSLFNRIKKDFKSFKNQKDFLTYYVGYTKEVLNNKLNDIYNEDKTQFSSKESTQSLILELSKNTVLDPKSNIHIACARIDVFFDVFIQSAIKSYNLEYSKLEKDDEIGLLTANLDELCVSQIFEFFNICRILASFESKDSDIFCGSVY